MRTLFTFLTSTLFLFTSCSNETTNISKTDSLPEKEALKKSLQEDLAPASDIKQFNWFYSAFAHAATTGNDTIFDIVIHPEYGLWIIHSEGPVPNFTRVYHIRDFKTANGKNLLPFDRDAMFRVPKEAALPVVDCSGDGAYNKRGCFTSLQNTFAEQKIWTHAGLSAELDKEIVKSAATITRTVINTENYRFYFSLIKGSWYLTFMDVMRPCEA